jgi:anti-sigma factor RsiW
MNQQSSETHYSEADLLDTYYMQPGASMPVMMHLADCSDCAARYERLEKKVRGLAACAHDDKPETFWARQRLMVLRKIGAHRPSAFARVSRIAAAALLVAGLGGWFASRPADPPPAVPVAQSAPEISVQVTTPADPWESEELGEYHSLVAWESWEPQKNGDQS